VRTDVAHHCAVTGGGGMFQREREDDGDQAVTAKRPTRDGGPLIDPVRAFGVGPGAAEAVESHLADAGALGGRLEDVRRERRVRGRLNRALVLWDALVPAALLPLAALVADRTGLGSAAPDGGPTDPVALLLFLLAPLALACAGGYDHRRRRGMSRLVFGARLLVVGVVLSWTLLLIADAGGWAVDRGQAQALALLMPVGWLLGRFACDHNPAATAERVLLVGSGDVARRVLALTRRHPERKLDVVGWIDGDPGAGAPGDPPHLGGLDELESALRTMAPDRVIVAFAPGRDAAIVDTLRECVRSGVQVDVIPRFFDLVGPQPRAETLGRLALIEVPAVGLSRTQGLAKRTLDLVVAATMLVLLAPVLACVAATVAIADGRPVFFRQAREGQGGRTFRMLKFRTMTAGAEPETLTASEGASAGEAIDSHKAQSARRVTTVGRVLRRSSIDELPQIWNVLKGDMSLVGPRPIPLYEAAHLDGWHRSRQDLKPGLTGLWQVSGRSDIDWAERMQLDYTYVSHWSLVSDLRILARTLPAVLRKRGAV
jgi:exopolysaccharide biosynthesis polyprenyl glycosylphosphotransferase